MPAPLRLREVTTAEQHVLERLSRSKTAHARSTRRARIVMLAQQGRTANQIAMYLYVGADAVCQWLKRFNAAGLSGVNDQHLLWRQKHLLWLILSWLTYKRVQVSFILTHIEPPHVTRQKKAFK